jgi:MerR family transcriptional regulator, light-induced transcriptional regulator
MVNQDTLSNYLQALLKGDRLGSRTVIEDCLRTGTPANQVYMDILWPVMVEIEKLYREDKIDTAAEHMATRINRTIVDQLQNKLPRQEQKHKSVAICCASSQHGELGAQMAADLFESDGWDVKFLGAGVSNDDLISFTNHYCPDVLLIYGATPQQAPSIRELIDTIKEINACPDMGIMLSGGVFERAEGLWEEIGADMFADDAYKAVELANMDSTERPVPVRTINRRKRAMNETKEFAETN